MKESCHRILVPQLLYFCVNPGIYVQMAARKRRVHQRLCNFRWPASNRRRPGRVVEYVAVTVTIHSPLFHAFSRLRLQSTLRVFVELILQFRALVMRAGTVPV